MFTSTMNSSVHSVIGQAGQVGNGLCGRDKKTSMSTHVHLQERGWLGIAVKAKSGCECKTSLSLSVTVERHHVWHGGLHDH